MKQLLFVFSLLFITTSAMAADQQAIGEMLKLGGTYYKCPLIYEGQQAVVDIEVSSERFQFFSEDYYITGLESSSEIKYEVNIPKNISSVFVNNDGVLDYRKNVEVKEVKIPVLLKRVKLTDALVEFNLSSADGSDQIKLTLDRTSVSRLKRNDAGYRLLVPAGKLSDIRKKISGTIKDQSGAEYKVNCGTLNWR